MLPVPFKFSRFDFFVSLSATRQGSLPSADVGLRSQFNMSSPVRFYGTGSTSCPYYLALVEKTGAPKTAAGTLRALRA